MLKLASFDFLAVQIRNLAEFRPSPPPTSGRSGIHRICRSR